MIILDFIKKLIFPPKCACCGELLDILGSECTDAMCRKCRGEWESAKLRICKKCGMESVDCVCSGKKFDNARLLSIFKFGYGGSADKFIYVLKRNNNKRFFDFAIDELYKRLLSEEKLMLVDFSDAYFVNVPRSRKAILEYGFDHAELLAKGVASRIGGQYLHAIGRCGAGKTQKKLDSTERLKNVSGKFIYDEDEDLGGKNIVLIDDVVTTGATVAEAIRVLRENNAGEITVLCLARTGNSDKNKNKKH